VVIRTLPAGATLCCEGDEGDSAYLVATGRLRAEAGGRVGEIGRGELVGEVSLMRGKARSATVTALRDSAVLTLEADVFADCDDASSRSRQWARTRARSSSESGMAGIHHSLAGQRS
jgi:CRP-like cAMP-binding protein